MSGGRLKVKLFAAGELVPAFEVFDAVREETAECGHSVAYYWIAKNKSIPFFGAVPGGLTDKEHKAWIQYGGGQELWDELYNSFADYVPLWQAVVVLKWAAGLKKKYILSRTLRV